MGEPTPGVDLAIVALALFLLVAGGALYALPRSPHRPVCYAALALGDALATWRHLGPFPALGVAAVGLAGAALLVRGASSDRGPDPLGLPFRLLLAGVAGSATLALATSRPLGGEAALDLNVAWYWAGGVGLLVLLGESGAWSARVGGSLIVAALGLALLHLLAAPPIAVLAAGALLTLVLASGGLPIWPWPVLDAALLLAVGGVFGLLSARALDLSAAGVELGPMGQIVAGAGLLLALACLVYDWLAGSSEEGCACRLGPAAVGGALVCLLSAAIVGPPGAIALVAALVPLATSPRRAGRGAGMPVIVAALAGLFGGGLALVAGYQTERADPALARIGLALLLMHVALLGAIAPASLWTLGTTESRRPALVGATAALGGLAALASLAAALGSYPWLLGAVGARSLLVGVGLITLALGGLAGLGETRQLRSSLHIAAIDGGAAWLVLGSSVTGVPIAVAGLLVRAVALGTAGLAVDALGRDGAAPRAPRSWRLLGGARVPLWLSLATLVGLPLTAGFGVRWAELQALLDDLPLMAALLGAMALGVLGLRRVGLALATAPVLARSEKAASAVLAPNARAALVPAVLATLLVLVGLHPAMLLDAVGAAAAAIGTP